MLSASEFTAGTFAEAKPFSLVLPRSKYETTALIGRIHDTPTAVLLEGAHMFRCFPSTNTNNWSGIIIPNTRIEVDEESIFDPNRIDCNPGAIIRRNNELCICAKNSDAFSDFSHVTLEDEIELESNLESGFFKWQVVIGEGREKRVLLNLHSGK